MLRSIPTDLAGDPLADYPFARPIPVTSRGIYKAMSFSEHLKTTVKHTHSVTPTGHPPTPLSSSVVAPSHRGAGRSPSTQHPSLTASPDHGHDRGHERGSTGGKTCDHALSCPVGQCEELSCHEAMCPIQFVLDLLSGKWSIPIVRTLLDRTCRTNELMEALPGISSKILTQRLRVLEEHGLVRRQVYPEVPPHVEYSLTEKGREVVPLMDTMARVGQHWLGNQSYDGAESESMVG